MSPPTELRLRDAGRRLEIDWPDTPGVALAATALRAACRCADCTRARVDGKPAPADPDMAIRAIDPIGGYAVNLTFSDGHARGIFPWEFLREVADAISCSTTADRPATVVADPAQRPVERPVERNDA
jgi:DUF971 family protein